MLFIKFLKTNWFIIGIALIVLAAFVRKNLRLAPTNSSDDRTETAPEKFTQKETDPKTTALLGWKPDGGDARFSEPDEATAMAFITRFGKVAVGEQSKFGIPASVLVASGLVNSFAGGRDLATGANNFFAMPCTPTWTGKTSTSNGKCFRRYDTAWDSFRDFSVAVSGQPDFLKMKKSVKNSPEKWLENLEQAGFSDVQNFSEEALKLVKKYRLQDLDK